MNPISLPEPIFQKMLEACPSAVRQVIAPPDGDLLNSEIVPIDVVTTFEMETGPCIHLFFKPGIEDIETLMKGGIIEFTYRGDHLHVITASAWGGRV